MSLLAVEATEPVASTKHCQRIGADITLVLLIALAKP